MLNALICRDEDALDRAQVRTFVRLSRLCRAYGLDGRGREVLDNDGQRGLVGEPSSGDRVGDELEVEVEVGLDDPR